MHMKLKKLALKYKNKFLHTYEATYENEAGHQKVYELISRNSDLKPENFGENARKSVPDAVGIIAFNKDKTKVLLQREFRMACGEWVYNFPGGLVDKGETPYEAAKRELYEETGLTIINEIETLPLAYTAIGISNELVSTVVCIADGEFEESTSEDEEIQPIWVDRKEIKELLDAKEPMSLRTVSVLYALCNDSLKLN